MKRKTILLAVALLAAIPAARADVQENIVSRIERESGGDISISMSDEMLDLIISEDETPKRKSGNTGISKTSGWRIQVFSDGRNQHTLESRAKARGNAIVSRFPKYRGQIYTFSKSPNWYTRIGNFRTAAEANAALAELKSAFPAFASEMRAVKSQIVTIGK